MAHCSSRIVDGSMVLAEACATAQATFQRVTELEHLEDSDELHQPLSASPIQPFWINESDSIMFYQLTKTAALLGVARGTGFVISRLPSEHPTLVKWSAPAFITISMASIGLSLGRQSVRSFTACMQHNTRLALYQQGRRRVAGLEAALSCSGLVHKADLIAVPTSDAKTVGVNAVSGPLLDLSFSAGAISVDAAKNELVYGPGVTTLQILHGGVPPPREMQPLYGLLNAVVSTVERVTPPARVSASLERMTAGFDPERHMVTQTKAGGLVVQDDGGGSGGGGGVARESPKDK